MFTLAIAIIQATAIMVVVGSLVALYVLITTAMRS